MTEINKNGGPRYITLLGDQIHRGPVASFVTAPDFQVAGLTAAFVAVAGRVAGLSEQEIVASTAACFGLNVLDSALCRFLDERIALRHIIPNNDSFFVESSTLENLCIDTQPDEAEKIESLVQHSRGISISMLGYCLFGLIQSVLSIGLGKVINDASHFTRLYNGFRRFNKLAKGEWAIVTMPPPEAVRKPAEEEALYDIVEAKDDRVLAPT
jgi:hypothetical protein